MIRRKVYIEYEVKAKGLSAKPCAISKEVSTEVPRYGTVAALPVYSSNPHYYMHSPWPYGRIANRPIPSTRGRSRA